MSAFFALTSTLFTTSIERLSLLRVVPFVQIEAACFFDVAHYILFKEEKTCSNASLELYYVLRFRARLIADIYHKSHSLKSALQFQSRIALADEGLEKGR